MDITADDLVILDQNDLQILRLSIADAKAGIHLGMFVQAKFGLVFLQPEIIFNSQSVDYSIEDLSTQTVDILNENYQDIDLPIIVGFNAGPFRFGGGPVGHYQLSSTSDIVGNFNYSQTFNDFTWGWQAGIGLDFWKMHIDVRYEGNLSDFGDHITFYDRKYAFDDKPSRLIASLGISF